MDTDKILFWNVDTQKDFIDPDGKLYVPGAELIKGNLNVLTELAIKNKIRVVN
ncbi:MAG: cysteine hydrolase, partial [Mariniphaga sp.]|nr:cysteine hydrolase [Mariniphaga sp.]